MQCRAVGYHQVDTMSAWTIKYTARVTLKISCLNSIYVVVTDFFSTSKQYVKIKLMQNETNLRSIFLVKTKYCQNFDLKA